MSAFINNSISSWKLYSLGLFNHENFLLIHLYLFCHVNCIIFMYMIPRRSKYRNFTWSIIWWTFSGRDPYNSRCDHHLQTIRNTCQQAVSCHSWNHFKTSLRLLSIYLSFIVFIETNSPLNFLIMMHAVLQKLLTPMLSKTFRQRIKR